MPCMHCDGCQQAEIVKGVLDSRACEKPSTWSGRHADISEYILVPEYTLVALPAGLEFDQAALLLGSGVSIGTDLKSRH